jgi:hypothetical protein
MTCKRICIIIFFIILPAFGCRKDNDLPTGDIAGKITLRNDDFTLPSDNSGVEIKLYKDTILDEVTTTGYAGTYRFSDKIYGKYKITISKEKYIVTSSYYSGYGFYHIGGASPTIVRDIGIYEIPSFILTVDSIKVNPNGDYPIYLYVRVDGGTKKPSASLIGFCSNSKDVSKDNYVAIARGGFNDYAFTSTAMIRVPVWAFLNNMDPSFFQALTSDTIFIRLYPVASGQDLYKTINFQALGKPSDVIKILW